MIQPHLPLENSPVMAVPGARDKIMRARFGAVGSPAFQADMVVTPEEIDAYNAAHGERTLDPVYVTVSPSTAIWKFLGGLLAVSLVLAVAVSFMPKPHPRKRRK